MYITSDVNAIAQMSHMVAKKCVNGAEHDQMRDHKSQSKHDHN